MPPSRKPRKQQEIARYRKDLRPPELALLGSPDHPDVIRANDIYSRFRKGSTVEEIALELALKPDRAQQLLDQAMSRHEIDIKQRLRIERLEAQRANERIRKKARAKMGEKFLSAIDKLLDGKKVIFSRDPNSGEILTETIDDIESLVAGIEAFRKTTSLEEKPMPGPAVALQIEQTNAPGGNGSIRIGIEESLSRIRDRHREAPRAEPAEDEPPIETVAVEVTGVEKEDGWGF